MNEEWMRQMAETRREVEFLRSLDVPVARTYPPGVLLNYPGLMGYWPGAVNRAAPTLTDMSGNGLNLTPVGTATVSRLGQTAVLDIPGGTGNYFEHADDNRLDIIGNEAVVNSSFRGLTIMCWVRLRASPAGSRGLVSKWNSTGNQQSYILQVNTTPAVVTSISSSGSGFGLVTATGATTMAINTWYFVAARFIPSTSIKVWTNLDTVTNSTSIPTTIFNSTAVFRIGGIATDTNAVNALIAHPPIYAAALPDEMIEDYYRQTRWMFE